MNLTLKEYLEWVSNKKFLAQEVVQHYLDKAKRLNQENNAFVRFHEDYVVQNMDEFSKLVLRWAPIAIKDMILTRGYVTSSGSEILKDYVSPYSSTCFEKLEVAGALMLGKTNCDQFGMGSSTENSCFEPTKNIYGKNRIPGWSSGGSAVAVAADMCLWALGTDTGGSSRQPAAMCGVVGMKPTYGTNSRYGVVAYASSFDQVGVFAKTVQDAQILMSTIAWYDKRDATTLDRDDVSLWLRSFETKVDISKYKFILPKEFLGDGLSSDIAEEFQKKVALLRKAGATVDEVSLPFLKNILSIYYTLVPAEASTNLARLDGIRFGLQWDTMKYDNISKYYKDIKSRGFREETKRRILIGTYVLSSENYEWFYLKAKKARLNLKKQMKDVFKNYDIVLSPTAPTPAWKFGEMAEDPLQMYLEDLYTVTANLVGSPAMSVPGGFVEDRGEKLPWGLQLMSDGLQEVKLFEVGKWLEDNW